MSSEDLDTPSGSEDKVSVKKLTFNGLVVGLIIIVGIAAFFAGSYTANLSSNQLTQEDLDQAMAKLELKLLQNSCY